MFEYKRYKRLNGMILNILISLTNLTTVTNMSLVMIQSFFYRTYSPVVTLISINNFNKFE